jgi:hypothetical protein
MRMGSKLEEQGDPADEPAEEGGDRVEHQDLAEPLPHQAGAGARLGVVGQTQGEIRD